jgi:E-phenylitaconyl-CoA hydratase
VRRPVLVKRERLIKGRSVSIRHSALQHVTLLHIDAQDSLNALTVSDLLSLREMLVASQDDDNVRAIVLTGAGEKSFCVGTNMKTSQSPHGSFVRGALRSRQAEARRGGHTRLIDLGDLEIWKPVIAAINGFCLGGGLELALQCDIRIASQNASFGLPEAKVASVPAVGGVQYLLRAIPAAHAMKLALTGDRIGANEALNMGLVSDVVEQADLLGEATDIAQRIAANGPLAVQVIKRLAIETAHLPAREFVNLSNQQWGMVRDSADYSEGRKSFAEKRAPKYRGE